MRVFLTHLRSIDWLLVVPIILIMVCGLITNFPAEGFSFDSFFFRQLLFVLLGIGIIICGSMNTYTILKGPFIAFLLFFFSVIVLIALLLFAPEINGAQSWFLIGPIAVQPVEFIKIVLIIVLAQYLSLIHI